MLEPMKAVQALVLLGWILAHSACLAVLPSRYADELDVCEATFRYQFGKNASALQMDAKWFFLAVPDGDPSDAFLKRFAGNRPPIGKVSDCDQAASGVTDKRTGEKGLVFMTGQIKWRSETEAEVSGGYYEDCESGTFSTYYLEKIDGRWRVIKDVLISVA